MVFSVLSRQCFGEFERINITFLQVQIFCRESAHNDACGILKHEFGRRVSLCFGVDGDTSFDNQVVLVDNRGSIVQSYEERNVVRNCNVVNHERTLRFVFVDEGDVDVLAGKLAQVHGVFAPFSVEPVLGGTGCEAFVENGGSLGTHFLYDGGGQSIVHAVVLPHDNAQHISGCMLVALTLEFQHTQVVGNKHLGHHHPVVRLSCRFVARMRAS